MSLANNFCFRKTEDEGKNNSNSLSAAPAVSTGSTSTNDIERVATEIVDQNGSSSTTGMQLQVVGNEVQQNDLVSQMFIEDEPVESYFSIGGEGKQLQNMEILDDYEIKSIIAANKRQAKSVRASNKTIAKIRMLQNEFTINT